MADPLSVLASVAGVATAGVAISKMIYEIAHTVKHAPREVSDMAGELSLLSSVLRHLRGALADCIDVCKPRLIKDIRGTVSKIYDLHRQIKELSKNSLSSFYRLGLLFRSPKTKSLLAQIEGFKNSVSVMLTTVQLAAAKKQLKVSKELASKTDVGEIRQLLENLLFASQSSIDRIRQPQGLDYPHLVPPPPPPPAPPTPPPGTQRRRRERDLNASPPPPPPGPRTIRPSVRTRRAPSPAAAIHHPSAEWSHIPHQAGEYAPSIMSDPRFNPFQQVAAPAPNKVEKAGTIRTKTGPKGHESEPHSQSGRDTKLRANHADTAASHNEPHHPSFVDWDSEKEEEVGTERPHSRWKGEVPPPTSTALVLRTRSDEQEPPTHSKKEGPEARRDLPARSTGFVIPDTSDAKMRSPLAREGSRKRRESSDEATEGSDYTDSDKSDTYTESSSHSLDGGGDSDDDQWDRPRSRPRHYESGPHTVRRHAIGRGEGRMFERPHHRTDLTHGTRRDAPEDAATWLYCLVFLDEDEKGSTSTYNHMLSAKPEVEVPRAADRLLLQWTTAEPVAEEETTSDVKPTMTDPDPSWSRKLRSRISRIKPDSRNPFVGLPDDYPYGYDPQNRSAGRPMPDTNQPRRPQSYHQRPPSPAGYRPYPPGPAGPPQPGTTTGGPYGPGTTPSMHIPDVPYLQYQHAEQERAYQTHRSETLTKDIERLENSHRRLEAQHNMEIVARDKLERKLEKLHEADLKSLQKKLESKEGTESQTKKDLELRLVAAQLEVEKWKAKEEEQRMYHEKQLAEAEFERLQKLDTKRTMLQISTLADRDQAWNPRFPSLALAFARNDTAPSATSIHGTLSFKRPFLTSLSELYETLRVHGWKSLWMRGSSGGQTWFLGKTPILVDFFNKDYMPQVGKLEDQTGTPVYLGDPEDEYAAVGMGLVERNAIDELDLPYKGRVDGQFRFGVQLTYEDVESLIATSLLMRERQHRKAYLEGAGASIPFSSRNPSASPIASTPTLDVPRPAGRPSSPALDIPKSSRRPPTSQGSRSAGEEKERRHRKKSSTSRRDF